MDPKATLDALLNAFHENDRETALEMLDALRSWIARGGFCPPDPRAPIREHVAALRAALAAVVDSADQWTRAQGATSDPGLVVSVDHGAIQLARAALDGAR